MAKYKPTQVLYRVNCDGVRGCMVKVGELEDGEKARIKEMVKAERISPLSTHVTEGWYCCYVWAYGDKTVPESAYDFIHGGVTFTSWGSDCAHLDPLMPPGVVVLGWDYAHTLKDGEGDRALDDLIGAVKAVAFANAYPRWAVKLALAFKNFGRWMKGREPLPFPKTFQEISSNY